MIDWREFLDVLPLLRNALIMGLLVGSLAPLIGGYFVLRRIVLLGVTIPQVSSAGIALVLMVQGLGWFGLAPVHAHTAQGLPMIGAILFTLLGIVVLGTLAHRRPGLADVSTGFTFAVASALSILLLSQSPVAEASMLNLLKGEIIATTDRELVRTVFLFTLSLGALLVFHKEFLLLAYDRDFAVSMRKPVARYDLLFYLVAGFVVSLCVLSVGPITTFGYLVLPPMIALLFTRGMTQFFVAASLIGGVGSILSLLVSFFFDFPAGPTTVAVLAAVYLLAWMSQCGVRHVCRWTGAKAEGVQV
jgi:ABC-type Mn2+/Zn2+ transport system permease subunit